MAGLLGANTEVGDGDPFPASCSVYAGRVRTGASQSFHVSELWGEEGRRVRREKQGLYVRSELSQMLGEGCYVGKGRRPLAEKNDSCRTSKLT